MTVPSAGRAGLAARSSSSACKAMRSSSLSRLISLGRRNFDLERVAAQRFDLHLVLQQFAAHTLGLGIGLVDLVDRHDHRHIGGARMCDRFRRLRHDAIVGGDDENHNVRHLGAARAHRREGRVTGRIDEGDWRTVGHVI